jgi:hypothetical protein
MQQHGGVYYNNPNELWLEEGITPSSSVNDVLLKLEKDKLAKKAINGVPAPPPPPRPAAPPAPQPKPFVETTREVKYQSPYVNQVTTETQTTQSVPPSHVPSKQTVVKDIYLMSDPVRYNYLYHLGLGYIPTYYTYERRRRLEDAIRSAVMRGLSMNKPQWEIEAIIKNIINDVDYGVNTTNITIQAPKKTTSTRIAKKPSRKPSKKTKKASKKTKVSKKKSKKASTGKKKSQKKPQKKK